MQNRKLLLSVVLLVFIALAGVRAQAAYSAANLKGSYGFLVNTWAEPTGNEGPSMGIADFDGVGAVTGSIAIVTKTGLLTGTIASGSSYSVKPNGTGSMTLILTGGGGSTTVQADFVLDSVSNSIAQGAQVLGLNSKTTNPSVATGSVFAINLSGSASAANLKGTYSFLLNNWTAGTQQVVLGTFTFDGVSKVTVSFTQQDGPGSLTHGTGSGTYAVNTDGSGSMTLALSNGSTPTLDFAMNSVSGSVAKGLQLLDTGSSITESTTGVADHQ